MKETLKSLAVDNNKTNEKTQNKNSGKNITITRAAQKKKKVTPN